MQCVLVRHVLPERRLPRSGRQGRGGSRLQEDVHHGPGLSGRQGCAQRLQARLQDRPGRRGLHQARPDRLRRRIGADPRRQAGRRLYLPAGRHGHQLRQAVRLDRPVAERQADRPGLLGRRGRDPGRGRTHAGHVQHGAVAHDLDVPQNKAFVDAFRKDTTAATPRCTPPRPTT